MDSSPANVTQTSATENTHSTSNMSSDDQYAMSTNAQSPNNVGFYGSAGQAQTFMTGATMPMEPQYVQSGDNTEQGMSPAEQTSRDALFDAIGKDLWATDSTAVFQKQDDTFQIQDTIFNNLSQGNNLGFPDQINVYGEQNQNKAAGGCQTPHFNCNNLAQDTASGLQGPNFNRIQAQSKRPASRVSTSNGVRPELNTPVLQASTSNGVRRQIKRPVSRLSAGNRGQNTQNNGYVNGFGFQNDMGNPTVAYINPNDAKRFDAYNMQHFSASGPSPQHISQPQQYNTVNTNVSSQNFGTVAAGNEHFTQNHKQIKNHLVGYQNNGYFSQNQNQFVGNKQQFIIQNATPVNGTAQNNVSLDEKAIKNSPTYKVLQNQAAQLCNMVKQARVRLATFENDRKIVLKALEENKARAQRYETHIKEQVERQRKQNMDQQLHASRIEEENRQLHAALANAGIEFQFQQPVPAANTTNVPAQVAGQKRKAPDADDTIDLTRTNDASSPAPIITAVNSVEQTASSSPEYASASDSSTTPAADTTAATTPADNTNGPTSPKKRKMSIPGWLKAGTRQPQLMGQLGVMDIDESRQLQSEANVRAHSEKIDRAIAMDQAKRLEKEQAEAKEMARKEEEKQQKAAKKRANESEAQKKAREEKEQREKEKAQRIAEAKARNDEEKKKRKAEAAKKKREEKKAREEQERIAELERQRLEKELEEEATELEDLLSGELTAEEEAAVAGAGAAVYDPNEVEELPEYQPRAYHDGEESEVSEEE